MFARLACVVALAAFSAAPCGAEDPAPRAEPTPWVVVGTLPERPPKSDSAIWTRDSTSLSYPALVRLADGTWIATVEMSGHRGEGRKLLVHRSVDAGTSWTRAAEVDAPDTASLFEVGGALYVIGVDAQGVGLSGPLVIRRSVDRGTTWTEPRDAKSGRFDDTWTFGLTRAPPVVSNGRVLWPAHRKKYEDGAFAHDAFVCSADVTTDLLDVASWRRSDALRIDPTGALGTPQSRGLLVPGEGRELLLVTSSWGKVHHVARVSDGGATLTRSSAPLPSYLTDLAGQGVVFDSASKCYIALRQVRGLSVEVSRDLHTWTHIGPVTGADDARLIDGPGWSAWVVDGDDLVVVSRAYVKTADPVGSIDSLIAFRWPKFSASLPELAKPR